MIRVFAAALCLTAIAGCLVIDGTDEDALLDITTDRNSYSVADSTLIGVTIRNTSSRTLYYNTCFSVILEDSQGQRWGNVVCECLCTAPLEPGAVIPERFTRVSLDIFEPFGGTLALGSGTGYRLRFELFETEDLSQRVEESLAQTNAFALVE